MMIKFIPFFAFLLTQFTFTQTSFETMEKLVQQIEENLLSGQSVESSEEKEHLQHKVIETIATQYQAKEWIKESTNGTNGTIVPLTPRRFLMSDSTFRLHCRYYLHWIHPNNREWVARYSPVTNMIAFKLSLSAGRIYDVVCYFVNARNAKEAECLRKKVQTENIFPWIETLPRNTTWPDSLLQPGALMTGQYCATHKPSKWTKVVALLLLGFSLPTMLTAIGCFCKHYHDRRRMFVIDDTILRETREHSEMAKLQ